MYLLAVDRTLMPLTGTCSPKQFRGCVVRIDAPPR